MSATIIANLEKLLGTSRDGALLRYSLGNEYLKAGDRARAIAHFREAVSKDPAYSAAWKQLGRALAEDGSPVEALDAWERGIAVATEKGDRQAAKEMTVFANRVRSRPEKP